MFQIGDRPRRARQLAQWTAGYGEDEVGIAFEADVQTCNVDEGAGVDPRADRHGGDVSRASRQVDLELLEEVGLAEGLLAAVPVGSIGAGELVVEDHVVVGADAPVWPKQKGLPRPTPPPR